MDDVAKPPAESPPPLCIRDFMVCSQRAADARHSPASPTGSVEAANEATSCSAKRLPSVAALQQNLKTQPQFFLIPQHHIFPDHSFKTLFENYTTFFPNDFHILTELC
jgi:hypothetical protein